MALAAITVITACSPKSASEENAAQTKALVEQAVAEAKKEMIAEQAEEKAKRETVAAAQADEKMKKEAAVADAKRVRIAEQRAAARANAPSVSTPPLPVKKTVCENCGVVISVTEVETEGKGTGLGAVTGGVVGGLLGNQVGDGTGRDLATIAGAVGGAIAGNKIEKKAKKTKSYDIAVKMDTGEERIFHQDTLPDVASGDAIKVENDVIVKK
ncbi:MAG: glycine zipper 2TM domain-containing protein [Pseudomonadota bacterium]